MLSSGLLLIIPRLGVYTGTHSEHYCTVLQYNAVCLKCHTSKLKKNIRVKAHVHILAKQYSWY